MNGGTNIMSEESSLPKTAINLFRKFGDFFFTVDSSFSRAVLLLD